MSSSVVKRIYVVSRGLACDLSGDRPIAMESNRLAIYYPSTSLCSMGLGVLSTMYPCR